MCKSFLSQKPTAHILLTEKIIEEFGLKVLKTDGLTNKENLQPGSNESMYDVIDDGYLLNINLEDLSNYESHIQSQSINSTSESQPQSYLARIDKLVIEELWHCLEQILQQSSRSLRHVVPHYSKIRNNRKYVRNYGKVVCGRHDGGICSVLALMLSTSHLSIDDRIKSLHFSLF